MTTRATGQAQVAISFSDKHYFDPQQPETGRHEERPFRGQPTGSLRRAGNYPSPDNEIAAS